MKIKCFVMAIAGCICVCNAQAEYRCVVRSCNSGYYAANIVTDKIDLIDFYLSCVRCPGLTKSDGTMQYGTTTVGISKITDCTLPAGTYKDKTGIYEYTSPCKYVN